MLSENLKEKKITPFIVSYPKLLNCQKTQFGPIGVKIYTILLENFKNNSHSTHQIILKFFYFY